MILTVNYDKVTGDISVSSDVSSISVQVNDNATDDNSSFVSFEVAIDTSSYEQINELPSE
jgi:hypothetical protein